MAITPHGRIHYPADTGNMAAGSRAEAALFVHEMTHVRQFQRGEHVWLRGLALQIAHYATFRWYDPYSLPVGPWRYEALNLEQQAQFVTRTLFPEAVWYA